MRCEPSTARSSKTAGLPPASDSAGNGFAVFD